MRKSTSSAIARAAAVLFIVWCVSLPAFGITKTWTNNNGAGDGRWLTAANWNPSGVPTSGDDVEIGVTDQTSNYCIVDSTAVAKSLTLGNVFTNSPTLEIKSGGTLTIDSASTTAAGTTLYLNNGNVSGAGSLTVSGVINHAGGQLAGSGALTIASGGALHMQATTTYAYLARTTTNDGTIVVQTSSIYDSYLLTSVVITNNGLIDFQADENLWTSGAGPFRIDNEATAIVRKSGGAGTSAIKSMVNNAAGALVEADTGTLQLEGGGTSTGQFDASSGTTLSIIATPYTFGGGATVTGLGKLAINHTLNVSSGADVTVPNFHMAGTSAKIDGTGTLRVSTAFDWDAGVMTGGGLTVLQGTATMALDCSLNYCYLDNRQFNLGSGSTTTYTPSLYSLYLQNASTLHVNTGATFTINTDQDINNGGGAASSFSNSGTVQKTGGSAATLFNVPLTSSGAISVTSGDLQFPAGATVTGGSISTGTTSNFDITGSVFSISSPVTISGTGAFRVTGGTLRIPTGVTQAIPGFTLANSAIVDGGGTLQLQGSATWTGGAMGSSSATGGTTEVLAGGTLTMTAATNYNYLDYDRQLVNNGTVNYAPVTYSLYLYNSADIVNNAVFEMQTDAAVNIAGSGPRVFTNNGTLNKTGGTGAAGASFNAELDNPAAGTINVTSGRLNLAGGGTSSGTFSIGSGAFIQLTVGDYDFAGTPTVSGLGTLRVAGGSMIVPAAVTLAVPTLQFDSGYISGAGTVQVSGTANWNGGSMGHFSNPGGTTEVLVGATLNISANTNYCYLDQARTLIARDVVNYTATSPFALWIYNGSTLDTDGTFNYNTDVGIGQGGSGNSILNSGLIYKSSGSGSPAINVPVNNSGTIQADAGQLLLSAGGTHTGGDFHGNGSGAVGFSGGTHTLDASSGLVGSGTIIVTGGTVTHAGTYSPAKLTITGGALTLNANGTAGILTMSNGTLGGTGTLTVLDDSSWSGGVMSGSGTTLISSGQVLTIDASTNYTALDGRTLDNDGTITYSPVTFFHLQLYNGGTLDNSGSFTITADGTISGSGAAAINNSGTLSKTGGTGTTSVSAIVNNSGTLDVSSGTLALGAGGTHTGNWTVVGTLAFSGGTHSVSAPGTITGAGTLAFTGATVTATSTYTVGTLKITNGIATLNANGSADALDFSNGTLGGSGTFTASEGGTWSGGTMGGSGQTIIPAGKTLAVTASTNYCYIDGRTLTNNGTVNYTAASFWYLYIYNSGVLANNGAFNVASDQVISGTSAGTFNNVGSLTKTSGAGTTTVHCAFNNSGTVTVSSGTFALQSNGTHTGTWSVTSPATLAFSGGTQTASGAGSITGTGTLAFTGATVTSGIGYTVGALTITGGTATLNANGSADAFTFSNGTLGGSGTFTANNGGTWNGGTMSGTGVTVIPAGKTLAINSTINYCYLETRTLNNAGTINYSSPGNSPYMQIYNNGTLNNSGAMNLTSGQYLWGATNGTINNSGTLTRSGTGTMDVNAIVNNSGQLNVTGGTLNLLAGGTHTNGVFTVTSPGTLQFSGGVHALGGTGSAGGTGNWVVSGGTTTFGVPYTLAALTVSNGTANFDANGTAGAFTFSSGTIGGTGTLTITDSGTWSGGTMNGTGTTVFSSGKTYTLGGTNYLTIDTRTVTNNGTMNYVAPSWYLQVLNNGILDNAGTLDIQTDLYIWGSSNGTINNSGTISRTTGSANTTDVYPAVNNNGTVTVTQGGLAFRGNGTHNGVFTATTPGSIAFASGTQQATASSTLGGNGTYLFSGANVTVDGTWGGTPIQISSGTATFNTNATIPSLAFSNGTLGGSGNVTVTGNSTWSGGTMDGSGTTVFDSGAVVTMNGATSYTTVSRPLQNLGTINYSAPSWYLQLDGVVLTNDGVFDLQTSTIVYAFGTGPAFQNNGTLKKTAGATNQQFYPPLTSGGTVQVGAGTIQFMNGYVQTAGNTALQNNAGILLTTLELDGGSLTGSGTITGSVTSDGIVAPGASAGALTITGNYTQSATGDLNIEIGGLTAGTQYDQLVVGGAVTLDGDLNVSAINGFLPASGNTFQVLTFGSRPGSTDFASKNGLDLGSGTNLIPAYSATDLQLTTNTVQTDLQIAMTATPSTVSNGAAFSYNVTLTNGGGSNASGTGFTGTLPANVAFVGSTPAICTGAPNLTCTFGNIPNLGSASVTINVTANGSGTASFTANAFGSQFDPNGANNAATAAATISATADLAVTVTGPANVAAGSPATYTIVVSNTGFDPASGVNLTLTPSAELTFNSASAPCAGGFPCSIGTLNSGQSVTITTNWTVSPTATGNVQLAATVAATSPADPDPSDNTATATTATAQEADVQVVKSGPSNVPPESGSTVTYSIVVTNNGPSSASSVVLDDPTPNGLTQTSVTGDCTAFPCTIGTMTVGQTKSVQVTYAISGALGTTFTNTATVSSTGDPNAANNSSSVATTVSNCPNASITAPPSVNGGSSGNVASVTAVSGATYAWTISNGTITSGQGTTSITFSAGTSGSVGLSVTVTAGACASSPSTSVPIISADLVVTKTGPANVSPTNASQLTYTVTVTNNGPSPAASVTLSDPTPSGLSFVSATAPCSGGFPCALGTLAGGQSIAIQATYSFAASSSQQFVTNVASAASTTFDPTPASASASTTIAACPNVAISGPTVMEPNTTGTAGATVINGATYNWTISNGTITAGHGTESITFTAGSIGTTTLNVTVTAGQCTAVAGHTINVTSTQADAGIAKSAPSSVASGATFNYTLTVSNNGPAAAETVTVTDALPPNVTFVSVDAPSCAGGSTVVCNLGTLANGASQTITITVTAPQGPLTLTNTASVSTSSADPNPVNDSHSVTTTVQPPAIDCPAIAPSLVAPADGAAGVTSPVTFSWTLVQHATSYELWLSPSAAELTLHDSTTGASLSAALPSGTYAWQVIARGAASCTPRPSAVRSFTIPQIDTCANNGAPGSLSPAGTTVTSPVTFSWQGVDNAIGYVVRYRVGDGAFDEAGTTTLTSLIADVPVGVITWTVDALFSGCPSMRSASATFTVQQPAHCEGVATLTAPANHSSTTDAVVDFAWTSVGGASEYRVWLQSGSAPAEVLGSTLTNSLSQTVPAGTHTWWVETLFAGCPSRDSQHFTFTILPAQNCDGRGRPTLSAPAGGSTTSSANVSFSWTTVTNAIEYELWLAPAAGVPTLIGTTATNSLSTEVAPGAFEWFVRAVFNGCPATESDHRTFTYEPPANCTANERAVLIAPDEGERVASPVSFDWSDVAGATSYELYVAHGNAAPELVATTTASSASTERQLGAGRWFVRTRFAAGCTPLDSTESRFVVIPQAAACSPLDAPVVSAPGQISSGAPARLQWSFVPGATGYVLETSNDPDFAGATSLNTGESRQHVFELTNGGSEPLAHYVRVRAVDTRCNPAQSGPFSSTAIVYVLPEETTEASALIGTATEVAYTLPLGNEFAGETFTATPTTSWITVTPSSGVVPAGGINLTVVAGTAGLPPGTTIGGVTITTGTNSRVGTQGTTVTTPITVNLVSPVTPTPKSTPPPDALIIPAVANADGIGSHFQSDVRVSNTSAQVMKYQLSFIPTGDAGISAGRQTTFSIEPGRTVALDDILKSWFGTGGTNAVGSLEVRPLTEVAKSTSSAPLGALANIVTFASSRTFNVTPTGTFGQHIPAIPFANFIDTSKVLSLQQIAHSAKYRTNLGLVEGSGQPANLLIKVFDSTGRQLTQFPVNLTGGQHTQINGFLAQHGVASLDDGRVEVSVTGGGGKVTAYASVLDNATADPLLVSPVTLSGDGNTRWVLPGVADLSNGATNWQTDMRIFNAGSTPEDLTLTFHSMNGGEPKSVTMTMQPGEVRQLDKLLTATFGVSQDGGAVHVVSADSARLIATARTYNQTTQGTYGQFISAVTPAEAVGVGSRPLQLLQVEESARYRSNIGLSEVTGKPVKLEVSIVPPDAKFTATAEVDLAPNEFRQINSLLATMGLGETYNARVTVRVISGEGRATAYASVIDAKTNDPTYVPAQ